MDHDAIVKSIKELIDFKKSKESRFFKKTFTSLQEAYESAGTDEERKQIDEKLKELEDLLLGLRPDNEFVGITPGMNSGYFLGILRSRGPELPLDFIYIHSKDIIALRITEYVKKGPNFFPGHVGIADYLGVPGYAYMRAATAEEMEARGKHITGGRIYYEDGNYKSCEHSGHYGAYWTKAHAESFQRLFKEITGKEIEHERWVKEEPLVQKGP